MCGSNLCGQAENGMIMSALRGSPCVLSALFLEQVAARPKEAALQTPREASNVLYQSICTHRVLLCIWELVDWVLDVNDTKYWYSYDT